jgi:hypothetical protein
MTRYAPAAGGACLVLASNRWCMPSAHLQCGVLMMMLACAALVFSYQQLQADS